MTVKLRILIVVLILSSTVPRLLINYGYDGDAIYSAKAAEQLITTGVYEPSRLPGNPLMEYVMALIIPWGGHTAANVFVLIGLFACIRAFSLITVNQKNGSVLLLIFALTPVLLLNAATAMDYLPGLALMLWSYVYASKQRTLISGILLGLSTGFRLSNILFSLPLALYIWRKQQGVLSALSVPAIAAVTGGVFYIPIIMRHGTQMFDMPPSLYTGLTYILSTAFKGSLLLGPIATVGIILLLYISRRHVIADIRKGLQEKSASLYLEIASVSLYLLLFLRHSDEPEYLLPALPFMFLLMSRWFTRKQLTIVGALILSFALFTVNLKGGESGRRSIVFQPDWGILIADYNNRMEIEALRKGIGKFKHTGKAVILTALGPVLTFKNPSLIPARIEDISTRLDSKGISGRQHVFRITGQKTYLVYSLSRSNVLQLQNEGYAVYAFSDFAPSVAINRYGYNPFDNGVKRLNVFNEHAFYKSRTRATVSDTD